MNNGANHLFRKLNKKKYKSVNICEVGVYLPEDSNLKDFIHANVPTTLVEADPTYVEKINKYFANRKNVKVIEAAVYSFKGKIELCRQKSSTFISELKSSPALINDNCKVDKSEKFLANSILFSEIDHGHFDLISIDIEGAEWYVIKHMISKPNIISIETHGKYYTNPNINNIVDWMNNNNYTKWYKNDSDTVFVKNGVFPITPFEKINLIMKDLSIGLVKKKKLLKRLLNKN